MTRVMRAKLLEVAARVLERDGLVDLADAVRWAREQLADPTAHARPQEVAFRFLEAASEGRVQRDHLRALLAAAATPEERALADRLRRADAPSLALATRLAHHLSARQPAPSSAKPEEGAKDDRA